jgi:hypothetical protein
VPLTSQTNHVLGITDNGGGAYTLQFVGTTGVKYYVQCSTNLVPPILWEAVSGSTNTVTHTSGLWGHTITNSGGNQCFFRAAAVAP